MSGRLVNGAGPRERLRARGDGAVSLPFVGALLQSDRRRRAGLRAGLEKVKRLPSCLGRDGTYMGFGHWEREALKGEYLVLHRWTEGRSVEAPSD